MVKSRELKVLRKKVEKAERSNLVLLPEDVVSPSSKASYGINRVADRPLVTLNGPSLDDENEAAHPAEASCSSQLHFQYISSSSLLSEKTIRACLDLFHVNMGDLYRSSSWGLDLEEKENELRHRKARFLLVWAKAHSFSETNGVVHQVDIGNSTRVNDTSSKEESVSHLAAFCHFRLEMDDDEDPSCAVLYVYEMQVARSFQRGGLGRRLMRILERFARQADLDKIMLTCFRANVAALRFYREALHMEVDPICPSQHGQLEDYTILSKTLLTNP